MALQIWLPLNGSLENKGLCDIQPTYRGGMSAANIVSEGKISNQSYNWPSNGNGYAISLPNFMNTFKSYRQYTISAWVKFTGSAEGHSSTICSTGNWNDDIKQLCFALYGYNNGYTSVLIPNLNKWSNGIGFKSTLAPNQWHHVAITYDGTTTRAYLNGVLQGTYNGGGITASSENPDLYVGSATYYGGFTIRGNINDFRIYDHCLSGKEISLVAQGLVAHYLLNNNGERQNLMNNSGNDVTGSEYRVTTYTFDKEGFGRYLNPGEKVTLTICFTPHANFGYWNPHLNGGAMGGWMPNIYSDGTTNRQIVSMTSSSGWNYTTHPDTTPANANICMYCKNKDNTANNAPVTIHWATLQIGNQPSEYWLPSRSDSPSSYNIEYDCSGYSNNATIIGPVSLQQNSPRYEFSSVFNGSTANIESYQDSTGWTDATISAWINPTTHAVNDGQDRSCIVIGGFYVTLTTGGKIATYCYGKNNPGYHTGSTTIPLNQWTHVVAVWNESTKEHIVYLNGKKEYTVSNCYGAGNTDWHKRKYIGRERWWAENHDNQYHRFFTGAMSDIRLYTTPLSEADVIELYNTPISIGKTGAVMAGMFKEV